MINNNSDNNNNNNNTLDRVEIEKALSSIKKELGTTLFFPSDNVPSSRRKPTSFHLLVPPNRG